MSQRRLHLLPVHRFGALIGAGALALGLVPAVPAAGAGTSWSAPVNLGPSDAGPPSLSVSPAGLAAIAFSDTPIATQVGTIYESSSLAGGAWQAAAPVPGSTSYDSLSPAVAAAPSGALTAIFVASQIDGLPSAYVRLDDSPLGVWSSPAVVSSPAAGRVAIQYGATGGPVVVRPLSGCGLGELGGATITTDCVSQWHFAMGQTGIGTAAWRTTAGAVRVASRSVSGAWSAPVTLASGAVSVAVGVDPTGTSTVAFSVKGTSRTTSSVWEATAPSGGPWGAPVELSSAACSTAVGAARAGDGSGIVAFASRVRSACEAAVSVASPGGGFGPAVAISSGAHASGIVAAATSARTYAVAWSSGGSTFAAIGSGASFGVPSKIGPSGSLVAAGGGGWATLAWCGATCSVVSSPAP